MLNVHTAFYSHAQTSRRLMVITQLGVGVKPCWPAAALEGKENAPKPDGSKLHKFTNNNAVWFMCVW